ncbi:nuclear polyadenylated RNA-binding protein 3 [Zygosaccharomyces mellis]|uniref:Nuclear polyadenylated RNA-binding protein 3 n=1 Tax=Zygosaccharomyces mellis TaxID=42258 RepID=A0A4C2E7L2_9SACH|nr:nuclear polyadenylated RNA-binding protein 3 [Zygosaccharomyces mellis]
MSSDMLNLSEFQGLSSRDKVSAIINMLNSNPDTALPTSSNTGTNLSENDSFSEQRALLRPSVDEKERPDLNRPMTAAERERYNKYLRGENKITEMHDIPPKSRLFIGNLPLKNVSKEELFRIFSPYGHILQINIKNAFGFIQYDNPQSVRNAIMHESQEMNFGKKLILEISSSNARPQFDHGDHGTNSSSTFISSSKRPFQQEDNDVADMYNDTQSYKKSKRNVPACVIYVKRTADRSYANEVFSHFRRSTGLDTDMIFLKPRMELRRMINDVAYDGVWGVILVNKTRNVDIQIFYKGPQGETKFDEYISISSDDAIAIFNNLKTSRGNNGMSAGTAPPPPTTLVGAPNPYATAPPPPHQSYYGGYGLTPPMAQQPPMAPQQPSYVQAAPSAYAPYGAPAPAPAPTAATPYGRYQPQLTHPMPAAAPPPAAATGGDPGQQQLLAAIQNLPPNVVSNLLAAAQQQQQQQQQPQSNQQLLGLLQSMQPQPQSQPQPQQQFASQPVPQPQFQQNQHFPQPPPTLNSPPQQTQQPQPSAGNNVQSLLDSLAKLQK